MKKELIILVGNIGTGKSTYAKRYQKKGYIIIARDQLRYAIGGGQYIFNREYEPVIWKTELYMFKKFVDLDKNIVVDEVGINPIIRKRYIKYAKKRGYKIIAVVMPYLTREKAVARRMKDPHGQPSKKLWRMVWEKFEMGYEPPSKEEGFNQIKYFGG